MKIFECAFPVEGERKQFRFDGQVERKPLPLYGKDTFTLKFENVEVFEFKEGTYKPFEITAESWMGQQLDEDDALADIISRYTRNETDFEALYVHDIIHEFINSWISEEIVSENGRKIPDGIVGDFRFNIFGLLLVTDKYCYYAADEHDVIMLDTASGHLVSDNYFASVGFYDSLDAIKTGEETLIYVLEGVLEE